MIGKRWRKIIRQLLLIFWILKKKLIEAVQLISQKLIRVVKNNSINDSKGLYIYDIQEKCPIFSHPLFPLFLSVQMGLNWARPPRPWTSNLRSITTPTPHPPSALDSCK